MLCKVEGRVGSKSVLEKGAPKNGLTTETDFMVDENDRKEEMLYNSTVVVAAVADETNLTTEAGGGDVSNNLELHVQKAIKDSTER